MSAVPHPQPWRHEPYEIEVEQALLGSILRDNAAFQMAADVVRADQFYDPLHSRMFAAIGGLRESGRRISPVSLFSAMKADPGVIELGLDYFERLDRATPALANVPELATIIVEAATRRAAIDIAKQITESAFEAPTEISAHRLLDEAGRALEELKRGMTGGGLSVIDAASFQGQVVPAREELVEGLIPRRVVTILGGDGATGKSLLALQLAVSVRTGANWAGRVVFEQGPVLYISAEDDTDEIRRRLAAIVEEQGASFDQLHGLEFLSLVGEDALLATATPGGIVEPTALFHKIEARVRSLRPALVVVDTLADVFGGDENSRIQARQFVGLLRRWCTRYGTDVLLLAHPSVAGMRDGSGSSGSTGWNNSSRSRLYLRRDKDGNGQQDDSDIRILRSKKANYGPSGHEIRLRWDRGVLKVETKGQSAVAHAAASRVDALFLELLAIYTTEKRGLGAVPSSVYAPSVFAADERSKGISSAAFADAMNRLFAAGAIINQESGKGTKMRMRIVAAGTAK